MTETSPTKSQILGKRTHSDALPSNEQQEEAGQSPDGQNQSPLKGQQTLSGMAFIKDKAGQSLLSYGAKRGRHPNSLWRDDSLVPRQLENKESIFDIIMPWVGEKKEEEEKAAKKKAGPVQKASGQKQGSLSHFIKASKKTNAASE